MFSTLKERKISLKLPSKRRLRVGVVDASDFGGLFASVFAVTTDHADAVIDIVPCRYGKELSATEELLNGMRDELGSNFVDIIVGDGLYMRRKHLLQCVEEIGCDVLIKTKEERRTIIEDAKGLFFGMEPFLGDGIERVSGLDEARGDEYHIIAASGFRWQELPFSLRVAFVRERHLKARKGRSEVEEFWVVTTDESLSGEDMRELAHRRWHIENNCFKMLNELVRSKRRNIRNMLLKEVLIRIWFIGLALFMFYLSMRGYEEARAVYGGMRLTSSGISMLMFISLQEVRVVV